MTNSLVSSSTIVHDCMCCNVKCVLGFILQKRIHDEIKRRLAILSKQWEEGLLSPPVQNEMAKLTEGSEREREREREIRLIREEDNNI